jgi:hypothetical protein
MKLTYYPDKKKVNKAMKDDDPLLLLVSFDGKSALIGSVDDALEHNVLLKKLNKKETAIDSYFRVVVNKSGADWTFVCPSDYKNIRDKKQRIETYWTDGHQHISRALIAIGYMVDLVIPKRDRRHLDMMGDK